MMLNKLPDNGNIINRLHVVPSNLNKMLSKREKPSRISRGADFN